MSRVCTTLGGEKCRGTQGREYREGVVLEAGIARDRLTEKMTTSVSVPAGNSWHDKGVTGGELAEGLLTTIWAGWRKTMGIVAWGYRPTEGGRRGDRTEDKEEEGCVHTACNSHLGREPGE